jgi:hypothetical protein
MLESSTIQKTIYLYWANYREFSNIQEAVKFSQKIYMAEHKHLFELLDKYVKLDHYSAKFSTNKNDSTTSNEVKL